MSVESTEAAPLIYRLGIISDTHVPDRVSELHSRLLPALRSMGVQQIFHIGDICTPQVLRQIEQVAPVVAVRGNRDWLFGRELPRSRLIEIGGVKLALTHGHGSFKSYVMEKIHLARGGYSRDRYIKSLVTELPDANVYIFGHSHIPENIWVEGKLFFNPGAASPTRFLPYLPSFGILDIFADHRVIGEIIILDEDEKKQLPWYVL